MIRQSRLLPLTFCIAGTLFSSMAMAEEYKPNEILGPSSPATGAKTVDIAGLSTGIRCSEAKAVLETLAQKDGADKKLEAQTMKLQMSSKGLMISTTSFDNELSLATIKRWRTSIDESCVYRPGKRQPSDRSQSLVCL